MRKIYTLVLITAVFYLEGKSQNVGIGTASPAYKLDVAGDVNLTGKLRLNGAATANKVLKTDASGNPVWGDDNNNTYTAGSGITLTGTSFSHTAHTGDATGATSLTVVGLQTRPVANTAPTSGQVLKWNGTSWAPGTDNNNTYTAGSGISVSGTTITNTLPSLWTNSGTNLYPNSTGWNVGIGNTTPSYKLHVTGDVYANGGWFRVSGNQGIYWETHGGGFYMTDATWIRTYNDKSFYHNTGIMRTDGTFQVGGSGATFNVVNGGDLSYRTNVLFANTSGNVGIGNTSPGQKLHLSGNFKMDGVAVEGNSNYRVYRNLGAYNSSSSAATGAFVIVTAQPWNSTCMFRAEIEGYFYDATAPFEITVGGYIYNNNAFYNYGYVNTGSKTLTVRFGRNVATNTVAIILGDEAGSYSYPKLNVTSFMQGHGGINESYAAGWTITQQTTLSGVVDYIVTVPDVTKLNGLGSGDFIRNQFASTQTADYWISGTGRATNFDLTNANTRLSQGSGNSLRISTNSGYTEIGPQNTSWSHFYTDRARYYFNKGITVDEGLIGSYDENLQLQTSGTTRITALNSNGYVGIGTTTPTSLLQLSGSHSTTQMRLTLPAGNNGGGTGDVNLQLWVSEPGVTWDAGGIGTNVTNDNGSPAGFGRINTSLGQSYIRFITNGGAMTFNTTDNSGNYYQTMYMTGGNVGIGTTGPSEKLHVTNNIRADGIVYWGNGLVRTESRNDAGLQGNAGARSGFFETSAPAPASSWPVGASSWWHLLDVRHSNNANNYALQIAGSFFDQDLYYRKTNGSPSTGWTKILTSSSSIGQSVSSASSTSETALVSNNSGSFSYTPGGAGWTPGTWQSTGFSVTKTITSGNMVHVTVTARIEGDNYNNYTPSCAYFRLMRGTTEVARTAVYLSPASYVPSSFWYYNSNTLSFDYVDTGVSGSQTYSVEFWLPNEYSATEAVFLSERTMNIIELKQ